VVNNDSIIKALMHGDLSSLTEQDKLLHYKMVCESVGLNPLTNPLQYLNLKGKLILYAGKNCTEQLRSIHHISIEITSRETISEVYIVTAKASFPDGRFDASTGAVDIAGLRGDNLANQMMKAETKAKRRATLSICSLGMLDESEVETIKDIKIGEVKTPKKPNPNDDAVDIGRVNFVPYSEPESKPTGVGIGSVLHPSNLVTNDQPIIKTKEDMDKRIANLPLTKKIPTDAEIEARFSKIADDMGVNEKSDQGCRHEWRKDNFVTGGEWCPKCRAKQKIGGLNE
jgi:hypothetical protein